MPETFDPARLAPDKRARYAEVSDEIAAVLEGEGDRTAQMATVSSMLAQAFGERFFWCGFYVVDAAKGDELVVGPYQGTLGCLRIAFGRGVCGAAAARGETVLVDDVDAFPGHIACDSRSRSEIVVPVRDAAGRLIAVLDVDSTEPAAFDAEDRAGLEAIVGRVFGGTRKAALSTSLTPLIPAKAGIQAGRRRGARPGPTHPGLGSRPSPG